MINLFTSIALDDLVKKKKEKKIMNSKNVGQQLILPRLCNFLKEFLVLNVKSIQYQLSNFT